MIIKSGKVFQEDGSFLEQTLYVNAHRLVDKAEYQDDGEIIDAEGLLVLPGLVDIHSHGAAGEDFSDGNPEGLKKILRYERSCGITSYCPTSMTFPQRTTPPDLCFNQRRTDRRRSQSCRYQYGRSVS